MRRQPAQLRRDDQMEQSLPISKATGVGSTTDKRANRITAHITPANPKMAGERKRQAFRQSEPGQVRQEDLGLGLRQGREKGREEDSKTQMEKETGLRSAGHP